MLRLMLKVTYLLVMGLRPDILSIDLCSLPKSTLPFKTGAGESWSRTSRWNYHLAAPWKYELFLLLGTAEVRTWISCCSFDIKVKAKTLGNCWSCWLITIPVTWLAAFISNCFTVGTRGSPQAEGWRATSLAAPALPECSISVCHPLSAAYLSDYLCDDTLFCGMALPWVLLICAKSDSLLECNLL